MQVTGIESVSVSMRAWVDEYECALMNHAETGLL